MQSLAKIEKYTNKLKQKKERETMAFLNSKETRPNEEQEDSYALLAMLQCCSQIYCAVLKASLELDLFDIIAKEGGRHVSASEVASKLPSSSQHKDLAFRIDRLLRLLASHSLLNCSVCEKEDGDTERLYSISPVGKYFVSHGDDDSGYLTLSFICHKALMDAWMNFKVAIVEEDNDLFKKVHGMPMYRYAEIDPTWNNIFNKAMANRCNIEMRRILEIYKGFEGISTLVDVGGGTGQNLKMIVSKYPSIKAINFDLPNVIQNAPLHPRIKHVEGDMFENVPKGDAIMLKAVCHNWSDENSIKVLRKCYESLPEKGKVIVMEFIMPEEIGPTKEAKFVASLDNIMFLHDGEERTEKEFESLCKHSGFSGFKIACRAFSALGVMEFYK
ncbi:isoliquiritigenin 2'-O-methyltransferase-like [Prosopis cineraria]|uniref:isoliquiritigenin 2'-O-methyltransferase-like n=1 Tax=Prosopis cineraria TaxID=364024 RepID=UPI00240FADCA|nr:isoliquiritigenin 2'-O-methyltransferase-like [Prosopis cineraria]